MRRFGWLVSVVLIAVSAKSFADTSASLVEQLQAQRQAFAQDNNIDLQQLSQAVQAAVRESSALDQAGNDADAIARLQALNKFAPLTQFPSLDVQMLCERIYTKLSHASDAAGCRTRAVAMMEILQIKTGSGATPDDPVRVITINEVGEWMRSRAAKISNVSGYPYHGQNLQAVTYTSPATAGNSAVAYFQFAPRLNASLNNTSSDLFTPLPVSPSDGRYQTALTQAREQRVKFLNDLSFDYPQLIQLCNETTRAAMQLAQRGDFNAALSKLSEIERIRPIRDIPIFSLISTYSYLLGKTGNIDAQSSARLYLFGITQDIAHSGNGLTPESAVHVVAISEEYAWVEAKKMRVVKQRLVQQGDRRYDMIDAAGQDGRVQTYYFEVSQVYAREGQELR